MKGNPADASSGIRCHWSHRRPPLIQIQISPITPVQQAPTVTHADMVRALGAIEGEERFKRANACGMKIANCFDCLTPSCDTTLMVRCSCHEHLCPKHRRKWLAENIEKAFKALRELKFPKLFVADSVEPEFAWENVQALRKELTKGSKVHFYIQDALTSGWNWEYRFAWIAEGSEQEHSDPRVKILPADQQSIEWALDHVCTSLSDFDQCLHLLPTYLLETKGRHFLQGSSRKGRGRPKASLAGDGVLLENSKLREEIRAILREGNSDGIEANVGTDLPDQVKGREPYSGEESQGRAASDESFTDIAQGSLLLDSALASALTSGDQFSEQFGIVRQSSRIDLEPIRKAQMPEM